MATAAHAEDQLDLFADLDAAADAATQATRQRILDEAPSIFGDAARGYPARVQAPHAWKDTYAHVDCLARSHAWREQIGGHGFGQGRAPCAEVCRPITLTADPRCEHVTGDCRCAGDLVYRGVRLHCDWEGEIRDHHNGAVEDAHDHAWPGSRELAIVNHRPEPGTNASQNAATQRWIEAVHDLHPENWLESGGPIRTARTSYATHHVPTHTGFGGYHLCGQIEPEPQP